MIFQTSIMFLRSTLMTFDLYIPFLLVKHHNFSTKNRWPRHFPQKKTGGGREYDKESDKGVHVHFWAPRQLLPQVKPVDCGTCGENLLKPKLPERRDLFPEFWVYVEQLRLLRSLGVTGAGFFRQPRTKSMTRKRVKIVWTRSRRCSRRCSAQKICLSFSTVYPVHCSLVVWKFKDTFISVYTHNYIHML